MWQSMGSQRVSYNLATEQQANKNLDRKYLMSRTWQLDQFYLDQIKLGSQDIRWLEQ